MNGQSFRLPIERPRRLTVHNWIFPALWTKPTPRSTTKRNQNIFSLITKHCNYHIIIQPLVCWLTKSILILHLFVHYVTDFWFFWQLFSRKVTRDCCAKFATGLNIIISHSSKRIRVIKLFFCQNVSPIGESFWKKDSLRSLIYFLNYG